jgi:hypothetical protein
VSDAGERLYIHPVGWEKHQHGLKRDYPWIKVHVALLRDPKWLALSLRQRGILVDLWLLYHLTNGEMPADAAYLRRALGEDTIRMRDVEALVRVGFLGLADGKGAAGRRSVDGKVLARSGQATSLNHAGLLDDSASTEKEESKREKDPPVSPPKGGRPKKVAQSASSSESSPATAIAVRERNAGWDFLVELGGEPLEKQRNAYGRVAADLNELAKRELNGATPDEYLELFRRRRRALVAEWGEGKATARSLVNNWELAKRLTAPRAKPKTGWKIVRGSHGSTHIRDPEGTDEPPRT